MKRRELEKLGWTTRGLSYLEKRLQSCEDEARRQDCYRSVFVFASPLFQEMWQRELQGLTAGRAQALLKGVMHLCLMPRDLSGTCEETAFLLKRFWPDCPPHSPFWSSFSRVVQVAFALDSLASKAGDQLLKRQIHQFRYLLSAYQTQWIREHYAKTGQTDEEAEVLEHTVSDRFIDKLDQMLDTPKTCPHGGTIPPKGQLLIEAYQDRLSDVSELGTYRLRRVQDSFELLNFLDQIQLSIGDDILFKGYDDYTGLYQLQIEDQDIQINHLIAQQLYIEKYAL